MDQSYTHGEAEDNLLGLTRREEIDRAEADAFTRLYSDFLPLLPVDEPVSPSLVLRIHEHVFQHLYDWAGKWRKVTVLVGQIEPPPPHQVPALMAQWAYEVNYRLDRVQTQEDLASAIAFMHHRLVVIHPFNNGNGRTARAIADIVAMQFDYKGCQIYHQQGPEREVYIQALRAADQFNYEPLNQIVLAALA